MEMSHSSKFSLHQTRYSRFHAAHGAATLRKLRWKGKRVQVKPRAAAGSQAFMHGSLAQKPFAPGNPLLSMCPFHVSNAV